MNLKLKIFNTNDFNMAKRVPKRILKVKVWLQRKRDREVHRMKQYFSTRMGFEALGEKGPDIPPPFYDI